MHSLWREKKLVGPPWLQLVFQCNLVFTLATRGAKSHPCKDANEPSPLSIDVELVLQWTLSGPIDVRSFISELNPDGWRMPAGVWTTIHWFKVNWKNPFIFSDCRDFSSFSSAQERKKKVGADIKQENKIPIWWFDFLQPLFCNKNSTENKISARELCIFLSYLRSWYHAQKSSYRMYHYAFQPFLSIKE